MPACSGSPLDSAAIRKHEAADERPLASCPTVATSPGSPGASDKTTPRSTLRGSAPLRTALPDLEEIHSLERLEDRHCSLPWVLVCWRLVRAVLAGLRWHAEVDRSHAARLSARSGKVSSWLEELGKRASTRRRWRTVFDSLSSVYGAQRADGEPLTARSATLGEYGRRAVLRGRRCGCDRHRLQGCRS